MTDLKVGFPTVAVCCITLLFFTVAATLFAEASKAQDGKYPYNPVVVPCAAEALKLLASTVMLTCSKSNSAQVVTAFSVRNFAKFSLPALCYFVSNNCMFYIIRDLGPSTFQVLNNLKVLATGVLMRIFMGRKLTWLQWKALFPS